MAKTTTAQLKEIVNHQFQLQAPMLSLWQTLAEHFYPERADFTINRNVGDELAEGLLDSYPVQVRRDLANSFQGMLRDGKWFEVIKAGNEPSHKGKQYLDWVTGRQFDLMEDRSAAFSRATKEGDNDFATFGQNVISVERNRRLNGLLYRCWHLRDCAWWENENGSVDGLVRKWNPPYATLPRYFKNLPQMLVDKSQAHGSKKFDRAKLVHIEMPMYLYDPDMADRFEYVRVWLCMETEKILEEVPSKYRQYNVSRFQTISGSAYAYSPATVAGLPNARLLQAMTHTLMEAAERYARPPMVATQAVIRSDVDLAPDGITWVDDEYDERLGAALRPVAQDRGGYPIGRDMKIGVAEALASAFYINKISLPPVEHDMTAYEVAERMKQYRRENLPLFTPVEKEYNGQLCETTLVVAMEAGFMGDPSKIPEELQGASTEFKFKSPLSESEEEKRATQFQQMSQILSQVAEHDEMVKENVNFDVAFRDALDGMSTPTNWMNDFEIVMKRRMARQAEMAAQQQAQLQQAAPGQQAGEQRQQ